MSAVDPSRSAASRATAGASSRLAGPAAISVPLIVFVLGPHLPPGRMSSEAGSQTDANTLMTAISVPIVLLVVIYFGYAFAVFRARGAAVEDGPPLRGRHADPDGLGAHDERDRARARDLGQLHADRELHGAGGGQGPNPIALPAGHAQALQVQVIGQQWNWTYRYPAYGNVETPQLDLPSATGIELHVTSLDVTHSFWAYELGVKADAVPGVDNVVFLHPRDTGTFSIRCAEVCGLWHGHMYQTGHIVSRDEFQAWIAQQKAESALYGKYLPPYSRAYFPEPQRRAG